MTRFRGHPGSSFVIKPRNRHSQLEQQSRPQQMLLFEFKDLATGIFDAAHGEISQHDDKEQEQRKANQQRHQGWIDAGLAGRGSWTRIETDAAIDDLSIRRLLFGINGHLIVVYVTGRDWKCSEN